MLFGANGVNGVNDVCNCVLHLILFYHIFFIFSLSIEINWECSLSATLTGVARTKPSTPLPIIGTLFQGNQVFYFRFMVSAPPRPVCPSYRSFLLIRPQNSPPGATMSTVNFYTWADWYYVLISNKTVSLTTTENKEYSWNMNHSIASSANESHGDGYFLIWWSKHWSSHGQ